MIRNTKSVIVILISLGCLGLAYFLREVFSGHLVLPQLFYLGSLAVRYYGIFIAIAAMSGFYLATTRAEKFGIGKKVAEDMAFWLIIGGFTGARLYHVLSSAGYYYNHPLDVLKVWQGGLSIYGAVLGGIITVLLYKRVFNFQFSILKILDWLTPSILLGQIIGRLGNLFNYEAFGYPTNLPWKMFVPQAFRPGEYFSNNFFHPWFLYEVIGNLLILSVVLKLRNRKTGSLFFTYFLLYNVLRLFLEFLRIDSTFIGILRLNVLVSSILVILSLVVFLRMYYVKVS